MMQPMPIVEPLSICAEAGEVLVEGIPGVAISMTPDVALAASESLRVAAARATELATAAPRPDHR